MNKEYKEFCSKVFKIETEQESLKNIVLKLLPISIINCYGYIIPELKKSEYKLVINSSKYAGLSEEKKRFYTYVTICHEIEHIKTFEKTKSKKYFDFEHFIALLEYISYLKDLNVPYNKIDLNVKLSRLILKKMKQNYTISTGELKSSLVGYVKASNSNLVKKRENVDIVIDSLIFLNNNMNICYNNSGLIVDKFAYYLIKVRKYIIEYPEILQDYRILLNFFKDDGKMKDIYDIFSNITEENKKFYDRFIINLLSVLIPNQKFAESMTDNKFKLYLEELINNYNLSAIHYYQNIELGKIFIDNEKILYENLKIILERIQNLNKISKSYSLKRTTGIII